MKKLCLGTFLHIISQAHAASVKQNRLFAVLFSCVKCDTATYYADDETMQGHLKSGKNNIATDFSNAILESSPEDLFGYFSTEVVPLIGINKQKNTILAFRSVIQEDTTIGDNDNIGPTTGYTKNDITKKNTFSFVGLLTNLFIYCTTQVKNIEYKNNIKEIHGDFVDSFSNLADTINIDEETLITPTPLTTTAKEKNFETVFTEVKHPNTLSLINPSRVRIYHLNIRDYAFDYAYLAKFIKENLGRYVFSRAKRSEYELNDDIESIALDAANAMKKQGVPTTDAHFAEIMLYIFLECALGAPKIMSKIELQNIGGTYKSQSSGIHLFSMEHGAEKIHQFVFGSTDILSDLHTAIDSVFSQIIKIKSSKDDEHVIVESNILNGSYSPEVKEFLKNIIIPTKTKTKLPDTAFGVFLGYEVNVPNADSLTSEEYLSALVKKMQADINACVPYIQRKIEELKLEHHSFYIYILPLDDIKKDKQTVMNKVLGD